MLVRRTANASVSYTTGKSNFQLGGTYEIRDYENLTADQQTVYGVDASWNWQFWRRTGLFMSPSWQHIQGDALLDDIRIYNRNLTPLEIEALYNQGQ